MYHEIKLNKRMFGASVRVSPGWITNGHWAIKRSRVANQALYANEELASLHVYKNTRSTKIDDKVVDAVVPDCKGFREFRCTDWVYVNTSINGECYLFMDKNKCPALFNREYIDTFGLKSVYGNDKNKSFTDVPKRDQVTIVIMPIDDKHTEYPQPKK